MTVEKAIEVLEYRGCRIAVSLHETDKGGFRTAITVSRKHPGGSGGATRVISCPGELTKGGVALARAHAVAVAWIDENWA
ncbi:hypothetical protein WG78_14585 [Amantichitinum ursilacus]|uniref:Uncharacterized protein n=1 Tax=Amantichitinum ursilacus TaxID=857265 RepID=A0A0N1JSK6_9NEIS|nr:hypothetical protein WG78_14585 [Amantichitinum ursilacus]